MCRVRLPSVSDSPRQRQLTGASQLQAMRGSTCYHMSAASRILDFLLIGLADLHSVFRRNPLPLHLLRSSRVGLKDVAELLADWLVCSSDHGLVGIAGFEVKKTCVQKWSSPAQNQYYWAALPSECQQHRQVFSGSGLEVGSSGWGLRGLGNIKSQMTGSGTQLKQSMSMMTMPPCQSCAKNPLRHNLVFYVWLLPAPRCFEASFSMRPVLKQVTLFLMTGEAAKGITYRQSFWRQSDFEHVPCFGG